jgi:hypothetical protein
MVSVLLQGRHGLKGRQIRCLNYAFRLSSFGFRQENAGRLYELRRVAAVTRRDGLQQGNPLTALFLATSFALCALR